MLQNSIAGGHRLTYGHGSSNVQKKKGSPYNETSRRVTREEAVQHILSIEQVLLQPAPSLQGEAPSKTDEDSRFAKSYHTSPKISRKSQETAHHKKSREHSRHRPHSESESGAFTALFQHHTTNHHHRRHRYKSFSDTDTDTDQATPAYLVRRRTSFSSPDLLVVPDETDVLESAREKKKKKKKEKKKRPRSHSSREYREDVLRCANSPEMRMRSITSNVVSAHAPSPIPDIFVEDIDHNMQLIQL